MLKFLYDFIPVLLFFGAFKFYGIYVATTVGIIATAVQVALTWILKRRPDHQQLITLVVFTLFGGLTLYFHNPLFVKWKPTVIFWIFAVAFLGSQFIGKKNLVRRMLEKGFEGHATEHLPWGRLNLVWVVFFALLGGINLFVAYHYPTDIWVNFKLYGVMGLLVFFCFGQAIWLARYMEQDKK